jgi:hypothetical protein
MSLKTAAILALALLASLACNVWQFGHAQAQAARIETRDALGLEIARAQGRADALADAHQRGAQLADFASVDQAQLLLDLRAIADRARERVTVYRDRITMIPAATCAPGADRMDAVNLLLEGTQ